VAEKNNPDWSVGRDMSGIPIQDNLSRGIRRIPVAKGNINGPGRQAVVIVHQEYLLRHQNEMKVHPLFDAYSLVFDAREESTFLHQLCFKSCNLPLPANIPISDRPTDSPGKQQ
jgi:hypothetical protein